MMGAIAVASLFDLASFYCAEGAEGRSPVVRTASERCRIGVEWAGWGVVRSL